MNPETNITELNLGGRLIPREIVSSETSAATLVATIRFVLENGAFLAGVSMNTEHLPTFENSVHPAWRQTLFLAFFGMYVTPTENKPGEHCTMRCMLISETIQSVQQTKHDSEHCCQKHHYPCPESRIGGNNSGGRCVPKRG